MSVIASLAKETLIYGLSYSLGRVINFLLVTSYLTYRVFTGEDGYFAIYQDLYFYIGLLLGVLTLRMETTYFRFVSEDKYSEWIYPLATQAVFSISVFFTGVLIIGEREVLSFLNYEGEFRGHLYIAIGILICDVFSSLPFAKLRYEKRPKRYAWIKLSGLLLNIFLVLFIFECLPLIVPTFINLISTSSQKLYMVLISNFLASILSLLLLHKEIKDGLRLVNWSLLKPVLRYSWPLILVTLSYTIIQNGYTSFLKYILPGESLENLRMSDSLVAATRLAVIMNLFVTAFNYGVEPFFFRYAGKKNSGEAYATISLFFIICASAIYIFTCINLGLFANLLGPTYRKAIYLVPILLMGNIFAGMYTNMSVWYKLADRTATAAFISSLGLILNVLLFIILIPRFGLDTSAWITLTVYIFISIMSYIQGQRNMPIPYHMMRMFAYLIFSIIVVYLTNLIFNSMIVNNAARLISSVVILGVYAYWVYQKEVLSERFQIKDHSKTL
ncbi:MAG: polysaccharide biosynthesis C-terminal domain-containing protein [Saprospiraceae bacterium]|nr:polysaccharide biosynthesis C-terminal domain-containing protein [Candidatus Vicinibacter proximus]HRG31877.1 polysaccharide biosynthesis C-terminal domain-containing protein [Saprospiraceae bacterium]